MPVLLFAPAKKLVQKKRPLFFHSLSHYNIEWKPRQSFFREIPEKSAFRPPDRYAPRPMHIVSPYTSFTPMDNRMRAQASSVLPVV